MYNASSSHTVIRKRFTTEPYQTVQAAPIKHTVIAHAKPTSRLVQAASQLSTTPLDTGGNVVANAFVGFGLPLTVTVGAEPSGDGCDEFAKEELEALRMVNREEVEYITPCVELRKRRK